MKKIGFLLVVIGFLGASLAAVIDKDQISWNYFVPAVLVGIIGAVMMRVYEHQHKTSEDKVAGRLADIETSIASIAASIAQLCEQKESLDTYQVRHRIDELFTKDIISFVDSREAIAQVYGLQEYADTMSYFASAERAINRAWSASTDGYADEVKISLEKANENFSKVNEILQRLKQTAPAV